MIARRTLAMLFVCASLASAQRHKPLIDPESKEGFLLQQIKQARTPVHRLELLNEYAVQYPSAPSIAWVYEQIQPAYMEAKEYDKVLAIGEKLLAVDPNHVEAAWRCLKAAEELKNPEAMEKYAIESWRISSRMAKSPAEQEYYGKMMAYSEFVLSTLAVQEKNEQKKQQLSKALEQLNPKSPYLEGSRNDFVGLMRQGASLDRLAAAAERELKDHPDNEDMLLMIAQQHMQAGDNPERVFDASLRVIQILRTKTAPEGVSPSDWEHKRQKYLNACYYLNGIAASILGRFVQADRNLRAALASLKDNEASLGAALYHLGYANYRLAENGERARIFDALKFTRQCAEVPSQFQEQAQKNIASIKSEYNLK